MRILLVQPRQKRGVGFKSLSVVEPLALESIAACLTEKHEVKILDLFTDAELRSVLASFKPDLCGISCGFTIDVYKSLSIAKEEALTSHSQLDGTSRPAWFIPEDQLPRPTPAPTPAATPAPSESPAQSESP